MKLGDKEFELKFTMKSLRGMRDALGCANLTEVSVKFGQMISVDANGVQIKDIDGLIDLAALAIYHGSSEFKTLDEVMELVTDASEIMPAANEFITAFNTFYGIKSEEPAGEMHPH